MIEELVCRVFTTRNAAHLAHWASKGPGSYAKHMALGSFYDDIIESIDSIVEVYQGNFGLIKADLDICKGPSDITARLREDVGWIAQNRLKISKGLTPVENLLDSLMEIYFQTIYKLQNLS